MKKGKLLITILLVTIGFQLKSQSVDYTHEAYIYMREYIHPLRLTQGQVDGWVRLNEISNFEIRDIIDSRYLSPNTKSRKIYRELDRKDSALRRILTEQQYRKFRFLKEREIEYDNSYYDGDSNYEDRAYREPIHPVRRPVYRNDGRGCF